MTVGGCSGLVVKASWVEDGPQGNCVDQGLELHLDEFEGFTLNDKIECIE